MAKAKKSNESAAENKTAAKKAAAKAPAKKSAPSQSGAGAAPHVDTNLAAQSAARMLAAGAHAKREQADQSQNQPKQESSLFKQLKAGLNKPAASAMNNLLDKSGGPVQKRPNQPFGG